LPDGTPIGMTCSSLCSVSLDPPILLVCLRSASPTLAAVLARGAFSVNLLHEDASAAARLFASGVEDRFARVRWASGPGSTLPHLSEEAHTIADCTVWQRDEVGDHVVVYGRVLRVHEPPATPKPLVYGLCRYAGWPPR
jgi:flavin reductase (DIM6/NTAB) family NADH-FMN oxidoreductase RutF